jgi:hypothetical protein
MFFHQDERFAAGLELVAVAVGELLADFLGREMKVVGGLGGEQRADGKADEVVGEGHGVGLVEIVDAPDEPALGVAPRAEILDVEVADDVGLLGAREFAAALRPDLRPPIIGGAEVEERVGAHLLVLVVEIGPHDGDLSLEPGLEAARCLDDLHAASLRLEQGKCQTARKTVEMTRCAKKAGTEVS